MNTFSNRSLVAPQTPAFSMARDVVRIVITAVLAGTGFALLLALAVLSLTVIAPPAQASGAPAMVSSEPEQMPRAPSEKPGKQTSEQTRGSLLGEAFAAQALPADVPKGRSKERVFGSLPGLATPVGWSLILALLAGVLAFIVYVRRKS